MITIFSGSSPLRRAWLALLALAVLGSASAQAQEATQQVNVPESRLSDALKTISGQFGENLVAPDTLIRGKRSTEVSGELTFEQAVSRALVGTGLEAKKQSSGTYLVSQLSESQTIKEEIPQSSSVSIPLEELTVYGTKQSLSIQDTQTSVSVVTSEQIEERGLFNLEDVFLRTPNVSTRGGSLNDVSIRGISRNGVSGGATIQSTTNIFVDGAPASGIANFGALNLWDIEQVEVLRGPQSTTQGRNALAGAIVIQSADPEYEYGVEGRVLFGNENSRQYSGAVTGPIVSDQMAFRLSADYREVDFDVVNQISQRDTRFQEGLALRGKLLIEPEALAKLRLELTGEYRETDTADFNNVNAPVPISDPTFSDFDPFGNESFSVFNNFSDIKSSRFIADADYQVTDNWRVKLLGTYDETERDREIGENADFVTEDTHSIELRGFFDYGRTSGWIGAYFFDFSSDTLSTVNVQASVFPFPLDPVDSIITGVLGNKTAIENTAIFGDITYRVSDRVTLSFGARYDWEDLDGSSTGSSGSIPSDCVVPAFGGAPCSVLLPVNPNPPEDNSYEAFLPRGALVYDLDEYRSVALTIARGYRAGTAQTVLTADAELVTRSVDPEFLTSYELAWRSEWPAIGLIANANVFFSDWTDQQVSIPGTETGIFDTVTLNAGKSELYGIELSTQVELTDTLSLFANFGLLWTEFIDFPFAVDDQAEPVNTDNPQFANLAGDSFFSAPRVTASLGLSYETQQGFFANTNGSYASRQFSSVPNLDENQSDRSLLVNVRAGYRFDHFEVAAFVDNLFDDRVALQRGLLNVQARSGTVTEVQNPSFTVNEPRLFGVELRVRY